MARRLPDYLAEFVGTGLLLLIGLSAVTVDFATGSPVPAWVPNEDLRRLVTGLVFAGGATAIVYSPLGKRSGGHINPAVTLAFYYLGQIRLRDALLYIVAQVAGALAGAALVLLLWGPLARSVSVGVTMPGLGGTLVSLVAEFVITFLLVMLILQFVDRPALMPFTALAAGLLVTFLVFVEAPISGTSLNPARTVGPALVSGVTTDLWLYLVAPPLGALLAAVLFRRFRGTTPCAKLYHTDAYPCHFTPCAYTRQAVQPDVDVSQPVQEGVG